ncbi:phage tail protein [Vibrio astriarenae]|uniref:phage tail protein n=1 Tax=Vibrio astriarenae TaxID=1481923 RepID=UPI003734DC6E
MIPHDDLFSQGGTSFASVQSIREVKYGDGYGQRGVDGLNSIVRTGSITWIPLTLEERNEVHAHWDSVGVVLSFDWAAPNDIERRWRYTDGLSEDNIGDKYILSVTVEEVFE